METLNKPQVVIYQVKAVINVETKDVDFLVLLISKNLSSRLSACMTTHMIIPRSYIMVVTLT